MSRNPKIAGFYFDELNEDKFAEHGLSSRQVAQILDSDYYVVRNRKRRRGFYLIIGHDHGGKCLAVPIEPTSEKGFWRPITAWPCKAAEQAIYGG